MRHKLSRRTAITYGIGAGLIVLFGLLGYLPNWLRGHQLRDEIAQSRAALGQSAVQSRQLEEATRRGRYLQMQTGAFADLVQTRRDLGPFLVGLSQAMDASGLSNTSKQAPPPIRLKNCEQQPIEITASGNYENVYKFLGRLEHLRRRSILNSLRIEADHDVSGQVNMKVTLSIFSHEPES